MIVQEYLTTPLLIDGYKFDIRLYCMALSVDPLQIYLYKEGLVRLATEKYTGPSAKNFNRKYVHLTNYAINKLNPQFVNN